MLKGAVIGLGKMGLSHAAILNAHPKVDLVAVCDTSSFILSVIKKLGTSRIYDDYSKLLSRETLDFLFIATPTKFHYQMVKKAIEKGIHVFCEKPFCLTVEQGQELVELAEKKNIINQIGYHNHFIGTFIELKRLLDVGVIGELIHFTGEAYGPVVIREKGGTWRSKPEEGGGCLYDYASHVLNLIQEIIGRPINAKGSLLKSFYSKGVEDAVYGTLILENGTTGTLSVNWSDETYRKMSTSITLLGKKGKIICDATEIKIYLQEPDSINSFDKGWNTRYITDFALPVNFYLRGEEYSAQIDYFIDSIVSNRKGEINSFEQGLYTDKIIELIIADAKN